MGQRGGVEPKKKKEKKKKKRKERKKERQKERKKRVVTECILNPLFCLNSKKKTNKQATNEQKTSLL